MNPGDLNGDVIQGRSTCWNTSDVHMVGGSWSPWANCSYMCNLLLSIRFVLSFVWGPSWSVCAQVVCALIECWLSSDSFVFVREARDLFVEVRSYVTCGSLGIRFLIVHGDPSWSVWVCPTYARFVYCFLSSYLYCVGDTRDLFGDPSVHASCALYGYFLMCLFVLVREDRCIALFRMLCLLCISVPGWSSWSVWLSASFVNTRTKMTMHTRHNSPWVLKNRPRGTARAALPARNCQFLCNCEGPFWSACVVAFHCCSYFFWTGFPYRGQVASRSVFLCTWKHGFVGRALCRYLLKHVYDTCWNRAVRCELVCLIPAQ